MDTGGEDIFKTWLEEVLGMAKFSEACSAAIDLDPLVVKYLVQFSSTLRNAPYEKELSDRGPVLSPPYRRAPPKMRIFS